MCTMESLEFSSLLYDVSVAHAFTRIRDHMTHLLLVGAGFSRNYGGWLSDELTGDIMGRVSSDPDLVKYLRGENGFEGALEEVRRLYRGRPGHPVLAQRLFSLQNAIEESFAEMNAIFEQRRNLGFLGEDRMHSVDAFLARFDAIFTLNQDLLLEKVYRPQDFNEFSGRNWQATDLPGMSYIPKSDDQDEMWIPSKGGDAFDPSPDCQPIFKLHGSVKWIGIDDYPIGKPADKMLIMGTNKVHEIEQSGVLSYYFRKFETELAAPGTRLMVIGYAFRDEHINRAIVDAGENLETFIVDPMGQKVLEAGNVIKQRGVGIALTEPIEEIKLIGISRRPISESFKGDWLAWNQLHRFFKA